MADHRRLALGVALAALLGAAACSEQKPAEPAAPAETRAVAGEEPTPTPPRPAPAVPASNGDTVGGDGSEIMLNTLSAADVEANPVQGELGCSFGGAGASSPLLLAKGDVGTKDAAFGLVKVGDYVERIAQPGGFNAITKGGTFSGQGKTIVIALTGPAVGGGESPPRPATLTYQRADGASRVFTGLWTCGP
jgi:hypothetical protein